MGFSLNKVLLAGLALTGAASAALLRGKRDQSCNGSPALCDRLYSNVTFVGAHDSAFVGILPTQNQFISVTDQLGMGVRYLQAQTHNLNGNIQLCHTSCIELNAGTLQDYLDDVKTFLDNNPNEVVSMLLTNPDNIDMAKFGTVFAAAGLDTYGYAPSTTLTLSEWPTLRSLISTGKRLIVFMDYHADTSKVPYILDEFSYYFETPYDTTDANFPQCAIDRPSGASAAGRMSIVNHFLDYEIDLFGQKILIPNVIESGKTNSVASITAQTGLCVGQYGVTPNVVLLDFVSQGDAIGAQNKLNGL